MIKPLISLIFCLFAFNVNADWLKETKPDKTVEFSKVGEKINNIVYFPYITNFDSMQTITLLDGKKGNFLSKKVIWQADCINKKSGVKSVTLYDNLYAQGNIIATHDFNSFKDSYEIKPGTPCNLK